MHSIKAVVRNGRLETDVPLDLPEGTELLIPLPSGTTDDDGWDNSPEGIAAWLKWYDSLEPLIRNEKQEEEDEAWLRKCDEYAANKLDKDLDDLFQ